MKVELELIAPIWMY